MPDDARTDSAVDDHTDRVPKDPSDLVLAYLSCPQDAAKGFLGALLVTDATTVPRYFAFVSPVRPTVMQRILYGKTLDRHVKVDVITKKLFTDGLSVVPDVLFVDSKDLLSVRHTVCIPTAWLRRAEQTGNEASSLSPFAYDTGKDVRDGESIGRIVAALETTTDLLEPFKRLIEALKEATRSGRQ